MLVPPIWRRREPRKRRRNRSAHTAPRTRDNHAHQCALRFEATFWACPWLGGPSMGRRPRRESERELLVDAGREESVWLRICPRSLPSPGYSGEKARLQGLAFAQG